VYFAETMEHLQQLRGSERMRRGIKLKYSLMMMCQWTSAVPSNEDKPPPCRAI